jgi:hypothetical protein|tara:strand:+ start:490 stop:912 length:423 start_codon:yes stop_codon:yes gene_type:complete
MPIDFTNILFTKIIEPLTTLINAEFNVPVHYDEHRGNTSFLILPQSDDLVSQLSYGTQREYNIEINYQVKFGGNYNKNSIKQVSGIMERLKKLINNNPTSSNGADFFDANISSIEYEQDEDDKSLLRGIAVFNCQNIEAL